MELTNWKKTQLIVGQNIIVPASTNKKVILTINITNTSSVVEFISIFIKDSNDYTYYLLNDYEIAPKETIVKDDKLILAAGDSVYITTDSTTTAVVVSGVIM